MTAGTWYRENANEYLHLKSSDLKSWMLLLASRHEIRGSLRLRDARSPHYVATPCHSLVKHPYLGPGISRALALSSFPGYGKGSGKTYCIFFDDPKHS